MIPGQESLGQEDSLEKGQATHSSILAWRVHAQTMGSLRVRTRLSDSHTHTHTDRELRAHMRQWHSQKGKKDLQNLYIESKVNPITSLNIY